MDKAVFYPSQTNLEPVCGPEGGGGCWPRRNQKAGQRKKGESAINYCSYRGSKRTKILLEIAVHVLKNDGRPCQEGYCYDLSSIATISLKIPPTIPHAYESCSTVHI